MNCACLMLLAPAPAAWRQVVLTTRSASDWVKSRMQFHAAAKQHFNFNFNNMLACVAWRGVRSMGFEGPFHCLRFAESTWGVLLKGYSELPMNVGGSQLVPNYEFLSQKLRFDSTLAAPLHSPCGLSPVSKHFVFAASQVMRISVVSIAWILACQCPFGTRGCFPFAISQLPWVGGFLYLLVLLCRCRRVYGASCELSGSPTEVSATCGGSLHSHHCSHCGSCKFLFFH